MNEERWFPSKESDQVVGRFEYHQSLDIKASIAADQKVHRPIVVIRSRVIGVLGDSEVAHKVTPENQAHWMDRFPGAWEHFQSGVAPPVKGTLLSDPSVTLAGLDGKRIQQLKLSGTMTVEQLAGLSDGQCEQAFGMKSLRKEAQAWIARRDEAAAAEVRDFVRAQMAADQLPAAKAAAEAAPKKNRGGRPKGSKNRPKDEQAAA